MDKVAELLSALAEQLNVTTGKLWEVLLIQTKVVIIYEAMFLLVVPIIIVTSFRFIKAKTRRTSDSLPEWDGDIRVLGWGCFYIFIVIASVSIVCSVENLLTCIFNPEFWALETILDKI